MPSRILREGILTSERINKLNWEEEIFYRRLMSVVDDYGRFSANPMLLRAALYPLKLDSVRDATIERLLAANESASLVRVYVVSNKRYLQLSDFNQQVRSKSKYPDPIDNDNSCVADANQLKSSVHLVVSEVVVDICEKKRNKSKTSIPDNFEISDSVRSWAKEKGYSSLDRHLENFVNSCLARGYTYANWDAAFRNAISANWAKIDNNSGSSGIFEGVI